MTKNYSLQGFVSESSRSIFCHSSMT